MDGTHAINQMELVPGIEPSDVSEPHGDPPAALRRFGDRPDPEGIVHNAN